jgi:hypothetical protein
VGGEIWVSVGDAATAGTAVVARVGAVVEEGSGVAVMPAT